MCKISILLFYLIISPYRLHFSTSNLHADLQNKEVYIVSFKLSALASKPKIYENKTLSRSYQQTIKQQHQQLLNNLDQHFNPNFIQKERVIFDYSIALNAMSMKLTAQEAEYISRQNNILHVSKQDYLQISTDASASMVNADLLWSGAAITPLDGVKGEDIVVAVIDTGINMVHESFDDNPEDDYDFAQHNPFGGGIYAGWCDPGNPDFDVSYICNDKLIGAWDFVDVFGNEADGPVDSNFHGSSMSAIISGNNITAPLGGFVFSFGGGVLNAPFISGIAPHSHIIVYDVCDNIAGCPSSAILAAIEQAILDDVDIINLALDGGNDPWNPNSIALALLNANNLGIITSSAAGNATAALPNTIGRVNNIAPWLITVANSFHGRTESNDVSVLSPLPVPDFLLELYALIADGVSMMVDINAKIFYARDINLNNEDGCLPWNALDFENAVALIKSDNCSNELKVQNAQDAGANAVIIFNAGSGLPFTMTGINTPTIPAVMIGQLDVANNIISHIQSNSPTDTIIEILAETKHKIVDELGFVLYHSSLRGPTQYNISKPDISAPGTNIFAAIAELGQAAPQYFTVTGTSQSAAVVSGALALLKNIRPNWSPSELKSIVMLSAQNGMTHEDESVTNTDDIGSGMLDLSSAANSVLALDESFNNYINANPDIGGQPETLNIASLRNIQCSLSCSWVRTLTNKDIISHTWDVSTQTDIDSEIIVSESSFSLLAGESITLNIDFNWLAGDLNQYRFGEITFTDSNDETPQAQLSMVVYQYDLIFSHGFE
ncbi:MAG: S8 family serine peptidase [Alcanivoracaceae bacterium]|nr:S8 family serine peptidase [Alcanivoracaceae bacterium]